MPISIPSLENIKLQDLSPNIIQIVPIQAGQLPVLLGLAPIDPNQKPIQSAKAAELSMAVIKE